MKIQQRLLANFIFGTGVVRLSSLVGLLGFMANAYAETPTNPEGVANSSIAQILMLVAFGLIFYFMVFRPQSKRMKEHRDLVTKLKKGDEVLTSGGLLGKIAKINDDFFVVTIAEGIDVMVQKQAIATALPKGTIKSIT